MATLLKVTPEKLLEAANEFSVAGKNISSLTSEMMGIINGLKSVWQGSAANAYTGKFSMLSDDIEKLNRIIQEHVSDLTEMARTYEEAEKASEEESAKLLGEVVN